LTPNDWVPIEVTDEGIVTEEVSDHRKTRNHQLK